jgi:hypothetical protein
VARLATVSDEGHRGVKRTICGGIIRARQFAATDASTERRRLEPRYFVLAFAKDQPFAWYFSNTHTASMQASGCLGTLATIVPVRVSILFSPFP